MLKGLNPQNMYDVSFFIYQGISNKIDIAIEENNIGALENLQVLTEWYCEEILFGCQGLREKLEILKAIK